MLICRLNLCPSRRCAHPPACLPAFLAARLLQSQAEAHFPHLEQQTGMNLVLTDTEGKKHTFRFRFWVNNQSRWAGTGQGRLGR